MNYISSYCHISSASCSVNGKIINTFNTDSLDEIISELYTSLGIKYSKFHKMDELSKVGFIGTELIKNSFPEIESYGENDIALLFSNQRSSAKTDIKFLDSYKDGGIPSPSLFVYTLPNILIGEISIRNKWFGENMFTISKNFDTEYFTNYCNILLNKNAEAALCGWVNVDDNKIEAFFFFVTKKDLKQLNLPLESKILSGLYTAS
ncbi:MAG: 3-oxoacyl-ACP synthase [Flavobacteriales bacterium]|nr:3-oxoacyl-ACP synthase [Flavobacteriales bacterium]